MITNWFERRSQKPKRMSDTFHLFLFLSFFLYFPGSAVGVVIVQSHHSIPKNDKTKHTRHTKKEKCKKLDSNLIATVAAVWSGGVKVAASGLLPHRNELDANCNHTPLFHCSLASNSLSVFFLLSLSLWADLLVIGSAISERVRVWVSDGLFLFFWDPDAYRTELMEKEKEKKKGFDWK